MLRPTARAFSRARRGAARGLSRRARPLRRGGSRAILCRGAALRFLLTRAYDWINTPPSALVTRKDPLAYLRRLEYYAAATPEALFGQP